MRRFFFDTYALVELAQGKPSYERFRDVPVVTELCNLYELIHAFAGAVPEGRIRTFIDDLNPNLLEPDLDDLFRASDFKRAHRRRRISYVDALGYVLARKHGLTFLTGDKEFERMENIEFVR
ncbi:MAG: PIN domain-containing protein [Thermoplasmata archaeon]